MKQLIKCVLIICLFYTGQSFAACTLNSTAYEQKIIQDMGDIVINPNLNVGDVIAEYSWPVNSQPSVFHCSAGDQFTGEINEALLTMNNSGTKIHPIKAIPGVGMQIKRVVGSVDYIYPFAFTAPSTADYNMVSSKLVITLFKIGETVGSGYLVNGNYSWYSPSGIGSNQSILTSWGSSTGTRIITPSCSVSTNSLNQNIYLEPVNYTQLKTVGSTTGETPFSIQLTCNGGAQANVGYDNVELTFTGTIPSSLSNSDGVLINDVESTGAQGVGIQVLDNTKKTIIFDNKYTIGSLTGAMSGYSIDTHYTARYYRYGSTINPGVVQAKMIFAITYD